MIVTGLARAQTDRSRRCSLAAGALALAATLALLVPGIARSQVTLGPSLAPAISFGADCGSCTVVQGAHPSATLAAPLDGAIVRWRVKKGPGADWGEVRLRVLRPLGDGTWRAVRSSAAVSLPAAGGVHELPASLPIEAGDRVGLSATDSYQGWMLSGALLPTWSSLWAGGDIVDGEERAPSFVSSGRVVPLQADIEVPSNRFRFGRVNRNLRRGTAMLVARVPGPGRVLLKRTKRLRRFAVRMGTAGPARLSVIPRGRAKRRLDRTPAGGRRAIRVRARVRFNPRGGEPRTQTRRLLLVRRR